MAEDGGLPLAFTVENLINAVHNEVILWDVATNAFVRHLVMVGEVVSRD